MAQFNKYRYLYPPRPEAKVPPAMLAQFDQRGWWWQAKMNGTCTVIFTDGNQVIFKTRHDDEHRAWIPQKAHIEFFKRTSNPGWNVFVAELLHSKTPKLKNKLYLFDIIVHKSEQLIGKTFKQRQYLLEEMIPGKIEESELYYTHNEFIWRARNFVGDSAKFVLTNKDSEVEGVVIKNPDAALEFCKKGANVTWQVKSRKEHANYDF